MTFLEQKDLDEPLPNKTKFKESGQNDTSPIDFSTFTPKQWAKLFYHLQLDKAFSIVKGSPQGSKSMIFPPQSNYLKKECFLRPENQSVLDY